MQGPVGTRITLTDFVNAIIIVFGVESLQPSQSGARQTSTKAAADSDPGQENVTSCVVVPVSHTARTLSRANTSANDVSSGQCIL